MKKEKIESPSFLFSSRSWLMNTAEMMPEERGVYIDMLCYKHLNGSLPVETERLAKLVKMPEELFIPIWNYIKHNFIDTSNSNDSEVWKDIVGYEGIYQISNYGRMKSLSRPIKNNPHPYIRKERIIKFGIHHKGYLTTTLTKNCVSKSITVHRLVAQYFIPNPLNKPAVHHKDENKQNNHFSNLEWCTNKENTDYFWNNIKLLKNRN